MTELKESDTGAPLPNTTAPVSPDTHTPSKPHAAYPQPQAPSTAGSSSQKTLLSHHLTKYPNHTAAQAMNTCFPKPNPLLRLARRFKIKHSVIEGMTEKEMARWTAEGKDLREKAGWRLSYEEGDGVEVSDLFWKVSEVRAPSVRQPLTLL